MTGPPYSSVKLCSSNDVFSLFLDGKDTAIVGICPSQCNTELLKHHFSFVFGMVSLDMRMSQTVSLHNSTANRNGVKKSSQKR